MSESVMAVVRNDGVGEQIWFVCVKGDGVDIYGARCVDCRRVVLEGE